MMTAYKVSGMTCDGCAKIVRDAILKIDGVTAVNVDLPKAGAVVETEREMPLETFQAALAGTVYGISQIGAVQPAGQASPSPDAISEANKALASKYVHAVARLDHEALRECLHPGFEFNGPAEYHSASEYLEMIKGHARSSVAGTMARNDIQAIFADGGDCWVIYDAVSRYPGFKVAFAERLKIEGGKIISAEVKFNRHDMKQLMREMQNAKKTA